MTPSPYVSQPSKVACVPHITCELAITAPGSRRRRRHRPMATLTSLLTSSPLHVLLIEVLTRYLKNYGVRPRLKPRPPVSQCAWADLFLPAAVTNITREKLRVGIWSGNIILTDLELRQASAAPPCDMRRPNAVSKTSRCCHVGALYPGVSPAQDALDALHLPVRLIEGRIGRLQIRVPWSRLRSEPVVIECDDLLLRVRLRDEPDAAAHTQREQLRKRMQLDAEELLRGLRADAGLAHPASRAPATADSFLSRLGATLLDNLRVHLVRLHVRCEHTAGDGCFFACGGTLRRFEMHSTDADGQPQHQPVAARQPWLHKTLALEGASLYWDAAGAAEIATEGTRETVLPPTDASVLLRQCRANGPECSHEPRNSWSCALDPVQVTLTDRQYEGMLQLAADWTCHALRERCGAPPCSPPIRPPSVRLPSAGTAPIIHHRVGRARVRRCGGGVLPGIACWPICASNGGGTDGSWSGRFSSSDASIWRCGARTCRARHLRLQTGHAFWIWSNGFGCRTSSCFVA